MCVILFRLWHQLTLQLLTFVKHPSFAKGDGLVKVRNNLITYLRGRHGHDCMVVGFVTTCAISTYHLTTNVMSLNPAHSEPYSIRHNMIKFVNDLRQVSGFLRVLLFPPPQYNRNIVENDFNPHNPNPLHLFSVKTM